MSYPKFFDTIQTIQVQDPISNILGVFPKGEYEISYLDVVKSAGHSCPTVAGAYIMTQAALEALYAEERSVRGNLKVEFAEDIEEGVAGVIGNVVSHITGATDKSGFKGLQGKFARHSLMFYNADINASARFTRIDTGKSVDVFYSHNAIPADPNMMPLMQKIMAGSATQEEFVMFGNLWQERVQNIFENLDKVVKIQNK